MSPRVFLHVGSPKTGTTFLQNVLWAQRDLAAQQGVSLPMNRFLDHYFAALDLDASTITGVTRTPSAMASPGLSITESP